MLNVKKSHHYRIRGCETITDSSNRRSRISQLSNVVAPEPKESQEETGQTTERGPQKGSEKGEPTPSVKEEPSAAVEPQPSGISKSIVPEFEQTGILKGPEEEPEAKPSEVPVERQLFQNPELELDADADRKNKMTLKTKVASEKNKKIAADEEALVLHKLFSLEDRFDTLSILGKYVTKDVDIVSQEIAYESFNEGNHTTKPSQNSHACVICCRRDSWGYDKWKKKEIKI